MAAVVVTTTEADMVEVAEAAEVSVGSGKGGTFC